MTHFARRRRGFLGLTVGLIAGMDFLANTTVNFADTSISGGLGASPDEFLWVLTSYAASGALMILLLERLNRVMRSRTLLLAGLGLFVLGSLAAACSQTLPQLVAARVLQGMGGGPLMTGARVLLQIAVPPERRRRQLQGFMLGIFAASAPGPWLAAWLMQQGDWHALFELHALAGALVMGLAWLVLPKSAHVTRSLGHIDIGSALAFCLAVLLWMHTLQDLRFQRPDTALGLRIVLAFGLFAFLGWRLHRHPDPWLKLNTLSSRRYLTGLGLYTLYYLMNGATGLATPLALLSGEGFNLESAGRMMTMGGLCTVLMLPVYFRLAQYLPERRHVISAGFVLMGGLLFWFASDMTGTTPQTALIPILILKGLFPILVVIQVAGLAFREFKHLDFAHAYAMKNVLRLMANAVGAGLANLYWQDSAAIGRNALLARVDVFHANDYPFAITGEASWRLLEQIIDQQAALLAANQAFVALAVLCLPAALMAWRQRALQ